MEYVGNFIFDLIVGNTVNQIEKDNVNDAIMKTGQAANNTSVLAQTGSVYSQYSNPVRSNTSTFPVRQVVLVAGSALAMFILLVRR